MYYQIKKDLYLVSEKFETHDRKETKVRQRVNHLLILDASGSMYGTMERLVEDVINQISQFDPNDTISVGWFSSKGEFGWLVKGMSVREEKAIAHTLRDHRWAYNMTCFSDILADTENVIDDLKAVSNTFSLMFFSDGQVNQEAHTIKKNLTKLAPKLSVSMFIGYSDWYQREQMNDMAQTTGGLFVHSSNLNEFSKHFSNFRISTDSSESKVELTGNFKGRQLMIAITKNGDVVSFDMESSNFYIPADTDKIVYLSSKVDKVKVSPNEILPEIYAVSRAALQSGLYNLALDILGNIGDVRFIDEINNSFTVQEYGTVENTLLDAVKDDSYRFTNGRKENYTPKEDAFCMLDLMELLTSDENVKFLPYHPDFEYKKIGRSTKQKDGYPKFNVNKDVAVNLNTLVWNSKKLNLSVLARIPGMIDLDKDAQSYNLSPTFETFIWRNFAIISDGKLNVTRLPIKDVSERTLKIINEQNLIETVLNGTLVLDLTQIPIINRKIASSYTNLDDICNLVYRETLLEAANKVYGYYFKQLPEEMQSQIEALVKPYEFTDEQISYLSNFGVKKDGSFSPETEKIESTDILVVKEFELGFKGLNTIPKVQEVIDRIGKKSLTPIQQLVANACEEYETFTISKTFSEKGIWLKSKLEYNKQELRKVRFEINKVKFAVILGKTNFKQLPVLKEQNEYEFNKLNFILKIKDVEIAI